MRVLLLASLIGLAGASPVAQQPPAQAVDVHDHELFGVCNLGHRVRFQAQLFSDKSFYKHLGLFPSLWFGRQLRRIEGGRGASQEALNRHPLEAQGLQTQLHFWEGNRFSFLFGSSEESVGELRLGQLAKRVI